jgi:probable HAF family extracellular repeat protein
MAGLVGRLTLMFRNAILWLTALLLASEPLALAQGTYTQIDYPGATATYPWGVNTAGDISGTYVDATGFQHGFLFAAGVYTTIDYVDGQETNLNGLNDRGEIVGNTYSAPYVAFIYEVSTQAFTSITYPGASVTNAFGIISTGVIVGSAFFSSQNTFVGFELNGSTYEPVAPSGASQSYLYGISDLGEAVGYVDFGHTFGNFLFKHGKYTLLTVPKAPFAIATGVNRFGALVGEYGPRSGGTAGFVYQNGILTTLQFPGSANTGARGISNAGEVVGFFEDSGGNTHGFTWTPPAAASEKK